MEPQQPDPAPPSPAAPEQTGWQGTTSQVSLAAAPTPSRPGPVTAAGVVLLVFGVLIALLGALFLLAGAMWGALSDTPQFADQLGDIPASFAGVILVVGLLVLAYGVLQVVTGIFVFPGRPWARITGLILAILGALFGLVGILPGEGSTSGGLLVSAIVLAAYVFVIWALTTNGRWFARA